MTVIPRFRGAIGRATGTRHLEAWLTRFVLEESALRMCLRECWGLPGARIAAHDGGMGSRTWIVDHGGRRWVAKAVVPSLGDQFAGGLVVAQRVERSGIPAGAPEPAVDGSLTVAVEGHRLALLPWVPGDALTGEDRGERRLIGTTLAMVHRALTDQAVEEAQPFHWVDPSADHLSLRPWLRPAVTAALEDLDCAGLDGLSWGLLHSDPAPEAFRLDPATGRCGVIDWSVALYGPLMYDLASAVMYAGGPGRAGDLIEAYLDEGVFRRGEVDEGLAPMLAFRWAVQADYFARRIAENDMTGIRGPQDNEKGLEDARRFLMGHG